MTFKKLPFDRGVKPLKLQPQNLNVDNLKNSNTKHQIHLNGYRP